MGTSQQKEAVQQLIRAKRINLGMTQKELADAIVLSKYGERKIRRWENGESKPSNIEL